MDTKKRHHITDTVIEQRYMRPEFILFISQILVVFIVIAVSLVNISLNIGPQKLWITILCSSIGYILPNPKFKSYEQSNTTNNASTQT